MRCKKCGNHLSDDAKFCPICGKVVPKNLDAGIKKKQKMKYMIAGVFIAVWICIWGIFGLRVYTIHSKYMDQMEIASKYMKEHQYNEAFIAYAVSSHINPKKEEPYIKMYEIYRDKSEYKKAATMLLIAKEEVKDVSDILKKEQEIKDIAGDNILDAEVAVPEYANTIEQLDGKDDIISEEEMDDMISDVLYTGNGILNTKSIYEDHKIYYLTYEGEYCLFVMDEDGSNKKEICKIADGASDEEKVDYLRADDEHFYFVINEDRYRIVSVRKDGTNMKTIVETDDFIDQLYLEGEWIYYVEEVEEKVFYKINKNGGEQEELKNIADSGPIIYDQGFIYYGIYDSKYEGIDLIQEDLNSGKRIMIKKAAGTANNTKCDTIYALVVWNGKLIYTVGFDGQNLCTYCLDLKDGSEKKLADGQLYNLSNKWAFGVSNVIDSNKSTIFKIRLDGKEKIELGTITNIGNIDIVQDMLLTSSTVIYSPPELDEGDYESGIVMLFLNQDDKEKNQKKINESEAGIMSKLKARAQKAVEEKKKKEEEAKNRLLQFWYGTWYETGDNYREFQITPTTIDGKSYTFERCAERDGKIFVYYTQGEEKFMDLISEDHQQFLRYVYNSYTDAYSGGGFNGGGVKSR